MPTSLGGTFIQTGSLTVCGMKEGTYSVHKGYHGTVRTFYSELSYMKNNYSRRKWMSSFSVAALVDATSRQTYMALRPEAILSSVNITLPNTSVDVILRCRQSSISRRCASFSHTVRYYTVLYLEPVLTSVRMRLAGPLFYDLVMTAHIPCRMLAAVRE